MNVFPRRAEYTRVTRQRVYLSDFLRSSKQKFSNRHRTTHTVFVVQFTSRDEWVNRGETAGVMPQYTIDLLGVEIVFVILLHEGDGRIESLQMMLDMSA